MNLIVGQILEKTKVAGPGERYVIWVQGCARRCLGCFNDKLWKFDKGKLISINKILKEIFRQKENIEGVTFLGGEPIIQARALSLVAEKVKKLKLTVTIFTGFEYNDLLKKNDFYINKLLKNTDLLIDGPYIEKLKDLSRPWVGSSNQKFHFLTKRYNEDILKTPNAIEFTIKTNGEMVINGQGEILGDSRFKIKEYA